MSEDQIAETKTEVPLSAEAVARIEELVRLYPSSKSAVMPALYIAQEELGWLTGKAIHWVADRLRVSSAHVHGVATFYTMFYKKPVGKYHIQVCRTLSCMICGGRALVDHIKKRFRIEAGEITEDGMWSYEEVECLGSCGSAPMVEINDIYFENLTPERLDEVLSRIEREQPDLRYSTRQGKLGEGLSGCPKSEVW